MAKGQRLCMCRCGCHAPAVYGRPPFGGDGQGPNLVEGGVMKRKVSTCPICGQTVLCTLMGRLRAHYVTVPPSTTIQTRCDGSWRMPTSATPEAP